MPKPFSTIKDAVPITDAAKYVPGRPNKSTIWRWCTSRVRGHKLATFFSGGRRMTTLTAIEEFLRRLNDDGNGAGILNDPSEPDGDDLTRRGQEANLALEKLGA